MLDSEHVLDTPVAVAGVRIEPRRVQARRFADQIGIHTADFCRLIRRVLGTALGQLLPHGNRLHDPAVLESHLVFPVEGRRDIRVKLAGLRHAARRRPRRNVLALLLPFGLAPLLALPQTDRGRGIEVGETARLIVSVERMGRIFARQLVPHHEAMGISPFFEVALLQQTRLHLVGIA